MRGPLVFKDVFKYYKAKCPTPNFDDVIDVDQPETTAADIGALRSLQLSELYPHDMAIPIPMGLQPLHKWQCYEFTKHPGLIIIRNPFIVRGQRYWMARCLRDYPRCPSVVNLNAHLFSQNVIEDWWRELQNCKDKDDARRLKISMRWTTLGYHHDWDTKVYTERMHTEFPYDLYNLCQYFATVLGYNDFTAEAAIVNYYPIGTTLSGHTDHSELNLDAPLFSFSFGQTAIFLIGSETEEQRPSALYLRSGDVLIMSKESRLCYHAVPRVMKAREESWNELINNRPLNDVYNDLMCDRPVKKQRRDHTDNKDVHYFDVSLYQQVEDEHFWLPFKHYLNDSRINMNVRQVLPLGLTSLH